VRAKVHEQDAGLWSERGWPASEAQVAWVGSLLEPPEKGNLNALAASSAAKKKARRVRSGPAKLLFNSKVNFPAEGILAVWTAGRNFHKDEDRSMRNASNGTF
jgi:hypothetical protein